MSARTWVGGEYMLDALWITIKEVIYGFAFAIMIGFSLGVLVGETVFGERAVMPYLVAIDTMPKVAFAPLFVAWLGFDITSKVALAAFIATFPIVVGTAAGLHAADENARMLFKTMGASRWQTLWKMKLPTGLPHIFTGLKIGAVGVMAGAITGEFLGGGKGFGELIPHRLHESRHPRVFSLILYLSLVGLALFAFRGLGPAPFRFLAQRPRDGRRGLIDDRAGQGRRARSVNHPRVRFSRRARKGRLHGRRHGWSRPISSATAPMAFFVCANTSIACAMAAAIRRLT